MVQLHAVTALEHPALIPYRTMRRQPEHRRQGIFVAEGEKVVRRLLESEFRVQSVLLPEAWWHRLEPLIRSRAEAIDVFVAPKSVLEQLTGFSMYQGVLAVGRVPAPVDLGALVTRRRGPVLLAALDGISSAENVGGIVRNCAAFGAAGLIAGETCASPFLRRAVRSSMGTIFRLPIIEAEGSVGVLRMLKEQGVRRIAADAHAADGSMAETDLSQPCCIIFGSEGSGLSPAVRAETDLAVRIPMAAGVDSLNVVNASAVLLYEAWRQRTVHQRKTESTLE